MRLAARAMQLAPRQRHRDFRFRWRRRCFVLGNAGLRGHCFGGDDLFIGNG
jgi:hypothetical protein